MAGRARRMPAPIMQMAHEQMAGALTRTRNMLIREFKDDDLGIDELNSKLQEIGLPEYGKGASSVVVIRLSIDHDPDERPDIDAVKNVIDSALSDLSQFQMSDDAWGAEEDGLLSVTWEAPS